MGRRSTGKPEFVPDLYHELQGIQRRRNPGHGLYDGFRRNTPMAHGHDLSVKVILRAVSQCQAKAFKSRRFARTESLRFEQPPCAYSDIALRTSRRLTLFQISGCR